MELRDPAQVQALKHVARAKLLCILGERLEASITQLAEATGCNRGTVAYHMRVLGTAGLVRVSRTRQVRAVAERYYVPAARSFVVRGRPDAADSGVTAIRALLAEYGGPLPEVPAPAVVCLRLPAPRASQLADRLNQLISEFQDVAETGRREVRVGFVYGAYRLAGAPDPARAAQPG